MLEGQRRSFSVEREGQQDTEETRQSPIPPEAPVETPEADPRTPDAPDPQSAGTEGERETGEGADEVTEEIGDAFR